MLAAYHQAAYKTVKSITSIPKFRIAFLIILGFRDGKSALTKVLPNTFKIDVTSCWLPKTSEATDGSKMQNNMESTVCVQAPEGMIKIQKTDSIHAISRVVPD
jgi:hypothetical protein